MTGPVGQGGDLPLTPGDVSRVSGWLFGEALPFWLANGLDRVHGGAVERLDLQGRDDGADFKRTRVAGRQLYAFSHAAILGVAGAAEASDHVYRFLRRFMWLGPEGGWPRSVSRDGRHVIDPTPDLYDYAFAAFGLAWRHRATGDDEPLEMARMTFDLLEQRFRHPSGGFHNAIPPTLPRQQNPHMHLTEAALALAETSGDERFFTLSNELSDLQTRRLGRYPEGVMPEFFEDDLAPAAGEAGRRTEPGHLFEWAWILSERQRLTGVDQAAQVRALVAFAERHGVDQTQQAVFNAVRDDGQAIDRGARTWTSTERIKGWIGLHETSREDAAAAAARIRGSLDRLFATHLAAPAPRGAWIETFKSSGEPTAEKIPASTFYHLFLAFSELLRACGET